MFISGFMLTLIGLLRLGSLIRYIPHAVTVGFTCGIAVTIFASQLRDLGGLKLPAAEPGPLLPKLAALGSGLADRHPGRACRRRRLGGLDLPAAAAGAELARHADRGGTGIGRRVALSAAGRDRSAVTSAQLPSGLPSPKSALDLLATVLEVLPSALSFTLLGAVESLLSAKVADGMTGRKHRYNMEVVAQGIANVASAIFGGISVTGTIARTATNIRAGACSPVSGMVHALFVLMFMLTAAPLASFIPLSALAGVLVVVCWNMAEKEEFVRLLHDWRSAAVLLATFGLTVIEDLTFGIVAGCVLAAALALYDRIKRRQTEF